MWDSFHTFCVASDDLCGTAARQDVCVLARLRAHTGSVFQRRTVAHYKEINNVDCGL